MYIIIQQTGKDNQLTLSSSMDLLNVNKIGVNIIISNKPAMKIEHCYTYDNQTEPSITYAEWSSIVGLLVV